MARLAEEGLEGTDPEEAVGELAGPLYIELVRFTNTSRANCKRF